MSMRIEEIAEERGQSIIDKEIALANSPWAIDNGYRLLRLSPWDRPKPKDKKKG